MKVSASYLARVAKNWQEAYFAANGKEAPPVIWERGWFLINYGNCTPRFRREQLERMTANLRSLPAPAPLPHDRKDQG
jgi:hypothetical protein